MSNAMARGRTGTAGDVPGAHAPHHRRHASGLAGAWLWIARSRQRRALGELAERNDRLLEDIGVTRAEALREAAKPFWRR
jgi:uncharacterized protein YjiS (DUF1127 family)